MTTATNNTITIEGTTLHLLRDSEGTTNKFDDDHSNVETLAIADCLAVIEDALFFQSPTSP